jgi:hypothetical protein
VSDTVKGRGHLYLFFGEELFLVGVGEEQQRLEELANEHSDKCHVSPFGLKEV